MKRIRYMLDSEKFSFVCLVIFQIAFTGAAYTYFFLNPGELGLILFVVGKMLIVPCGTISLGVFCVFYYLKKISLSGVNRNTFMIVAIGASLLIFPLLPGAAVLGYSVSQGILWMFPFIILLYPVIILCFVWYYSLASRFLDKQRL